MTASYRTGPVRVRVPASSANLGPGFDAMGLALAMYDDVTAEVTGRGLDVGVEGEGRGEPDRGEGHLVVRGMRTAFDRLDGQPTGLVLRCRNRIPQGRGLGSSAAAAVAGLVAARALALDGAAALDDEELLALATGIEGHPDNAAACLHGGLTLSWLGADGPRAVRVAVSAELDATIAVAPAAVCTDRARLLLPVTVPHEDAAHAAGRAALLVEALSRRPDLLLAATEDRLHQPYRAAAMPATAALVAELRRAGVPAVVSGAGPSVLAFAAEGAVRPHAPVGWSVRGVTIDRSGARAFGAGQG